MRSTAQSSKQDSPTAKDAAGATKRRGRGHGKGGQGKTGKVPAEQEFTDSFSKLQHGQPPILETMVVQTGVVLESSGKKKQGVEPAFGERQMSRKEYVQLTE